ncbi:MAG: Holliday junction resolvase RuvX [Phycisphaerae bacterium]|nr:Holliday junction resolvase RuvX [Phycisphaerae bacterium]
MSRWLGIDHGLKRVGLAVGSTEEGFAAPVTVLPAEPEDRLLAEIDRLAGEYNVAGLVVGWPVNMDDTEGPQARAARAFAAALAQVTGRDVRLWDERLSSFHADAALAGHLTRGKRKARQDALAATAFLDDFLRNDGPARAARPDAAES